MKITSFFGYFEGDVAESVVVFSIDLRLCRFDHVLIKLFLKAHFGRRERSDLILTWLAVDEVIEAVSIEFDGKRRNAPLLLLRSVDVDNGLALLLGSTDGLKCKPIELAFESSELG